jgi:hypothetical protein
MHDYKHFRQTQPKHTAIDRLLIASGVIGWVAICLAIADRLSS